MARQNDLFLLCDEAYLRLRRGGRGIRSCGVGDPDKSHSIICNLMSKNLGISGWRIGYVISNAELVSEILKINQHLVTCPATVLSYYLVDHFHDLLQVTKPQIKDVLADRAATSLTTSTNSASIISPARPPSTSSCHSAGRLWAPWSSATVCCRSAM